jgi:hypothetical protein
MIARLTEIERLTNSCSGNPRFRLSWDVQGIGSGSANTAADASYNYEIGNKGLRVGSLVRIELNGRGTIKSISAAA